MFTKARRGRLTEGAELGEGDEWSLRISVNEQRSRQRENAALQGHPSAGLLDVEASRWLTLRRSRFFLSSKVEKGCEAGRATRRRRGELTAQHKGVDSEPWPLSLA